MSAGRRCGRLAVGVSVLVLVAGCSGADTPSSGGTSAVSPSATPTSTSTSTSPSVTSPNATATRTGPFTIVALGDSVPAGGGCDCTPYPPLSATMLTVPDQRSVTATNDAVSGYTTSDVLSQLGTASGSTASGSTALGSGTSGGAASESPSAPVPADVAKADVVEIEVGANDVGYDASCGTSVACYQPTIPTVEHNLMQIVARVHELTQGRRVLLVLLDYWSVWLGGQYAAAQGQSYVVAAAELTDEVNAVIKATASRTGSAYVDLRAAFKGPDYAYDETHYLAPDGDHPNAEGHDKIASSVVEVITKTLHP